MLYVVIPWQVTELLEEYVELPDGYTYAGVIPAGVVALAPSPTPPPAPEPEPIEDPAPGE
jgi:hypothetical protein